MEEVKLTMDESGPARFFIGDGNRELGDYADIWEENA